MKKRYDYVMKYGVRDMGQGPMYLLIIKDGKVSHVNKG